MGHKPGTMINVLIDDVMICLQYMSLPESERLELTKPFVGAKEAPTFLRDDVWAVASVKGWTRRGALVSGRKMKSHPGALIATNGRGKVWLVELTPAGREVLADWTKRYGAPVIDTLVTR